MAEKQEIIVTDNEMGDIKSAVSKLRILSPLRMKRIDDQTKERASLLDILKRDNSEHFLGADRFHRIMDYHGTEGKVVNESLDGLLKDTFITRGLWTQVISGLGRVVDEGRRTQIYAELLDELESIKDSGKRKAINQILSDYTSFDPEIRNRATDESYFMGNMLKVESGAIQDTLNNLFI